MSLETFSFLSKLAEKSTGGEICGGQIDDRLNDHINLISREKKKGYIIKW